MPRPTESFVVFSDVHLASDLNDSGTGGPAVPRSKAIDHDLAELLAHYRTSRPPADRWHLVIAGDFIDFAGMAIDPREGESFATEITAFERAFGLGGAEEHVRHKLRRAYERHPDVFAELGRFVAEGHALSFVHGNHDLEMHWDSVKDDFRKLLFELGGEKGSRAEHDARITFHPWFFHRDGLVFIEHGHQYDPFCSTPYVLAPLMPGDPTRVTLTLSDTLLRAIVRRTPGMKEYGHEGRGLMSYISWGLMLGARGTVGLFVRFWKCILGLWRNAKAWSTEGGARVRAEHERRLKKLAQELGIAESKLRKALELHLVPLGFTPRTALASVMLDRLLVFAVMVPLHGTLIALGKSWWIIGGLVALWGVLHVWLSRGRPQVDPAAAMEDRAPMLQRLFPSSFVVMGHTHVPTTKTVGDGHYVNLGSWAEEEPDPGDDPAKVYRAARTHLVIHEKEGCHEAHLYEWRSGEGPKVKTSLVRPRPVSTQAAAE